MVHLSVRTIWVSGFGYTFLINYQFPVTLESVRHTTVNTHDRKHRGLTQKTICRDVQTSVATHDPIKIGDDVF